MTKTFLKTTLLASLSLLALACGDAGQGEFDLVDNDDIVDENVQELRIAPFDNDSAANPAVDQFLSITGTREIVYTDQISAEDGDLEDFVQFELPNNSNTSQRIQIAIDCDVFGDEGVFARVELFNVDGNDARRVTGGPIDCNEGEFNVTVQNDQVQSARIYVFGEPTEQTLIEYTLFVTPFR